MARSTIGSRVSRWTVAGARGPGELSRSAITIASGAYPLHHDRRLFELLILEGAQAGLSWSTILRKRPAYRKAFDRFDPSKIVR